jgi:hypothetical protein
MGSCRQRAPLPHPRPLLHGSSAASVRVCGDVPHFQGVGMPAAKHVLTG